VRHHDIYRLQHGAKSLFGAAARSHRGATGMENLAVCGHQTNGHFRASDINAQDELVWTSGADAILQRPISSLRFAQLG
jgi:hypothetical protein